MLVDYGSRDKLFTDTVVEVREGLLRAAGTSREKGCECVIVQGAGTMGVEAMLGTAVPRAGGKVLILVNGAYGHRQALMCSRLGIPCELLEWEDSQAVDVEAALQRLRQDAGGGKPSFTHVSVVHHETSAGVINPLESLARALRAEFPGVALLVDSMSGFGAYDLRMDWGIDFAVSSSNKCIEGVPGFCFAICDRGALEKAEGNARSLALDLHDQWRNMEATGQFRFTPPTHALLAFRQALREFEAEGSTQGRAARYRANYDTLARGMEELGFKFYVQEDWRSSLIITFLEPEHPNFDFPAFYRILAEKGFVIYPGKLAKAASFRFGTIGRLFPHDCEGLLAAVKGACKQLGVPLPLR
jgi:2-aminoethylphosphonate-pyruvate transaminase